MPCYKCSNNKWKYGMNGNCVFDTEAACKEAEQAIHARENNKNIVQKVQEKISGFLAGLNGTSAKDFKD